MQQPIFTIGSDPEYFFRKEDGKITSAIPYVDENKYCPVKAGSLGYYHDNVAVELTMPPAITEANFVSSFKEVFTTLGSISSEIKPVILASAFFDASELEHPDAKEFGCNPEFCVYSRKMERPPTNVKFDFRSAGGHIHIGVENFRTADYDEFLIAPPTKFAAVRALDVFLAVPLTIVDDDPSAIERKKLYGKAGRCRATDYGVEYRPLSNMWTQNPDIVAWTYQRTVDTMNKLRDTYNMINQFDFELVREIVDTGDKEKAVDFCKKYDIEYPVWHKYSIDPQW